MKKQVSQKWIGIILGALLAAAGVVIFIVAIANQASLQTAISIILAVCFFIAGAVSLVVSMIANIGLKLPLKVGFGCFLISLGVVLCIDTTFLVKYLQLFIGIFFCAVGFCELINGIVLCVSRKHDKSISVPVIVLTFIFTAALAALGIVFLCINNESFATFFYCVIGALILVAGIFCIIYFAKALKAGHDEKKISSDSVVAEEKAEEVK